MYCGECGTESEASDTFCASCGEPLSQPATLLAPTPPAAATYPTASPSHAYAPGPVMYAQTTNGMAIAALVCGLLGIFVLAMIFGYIGRRQIDDSGGRMSGRGMAVAGIVLGWIGLVLFVLWIVLIIVVLAAASHSSS
jgi:hypothetical protein